MRRRENDKTYQEDEELRDHWCHKESGAVVIEVGPKQFIIRVPNRPDTPISGDDAEERAFLIADLFINQQKT